MTERILQHGDIVTVAFPEQIPQAREQEGYRPAIIVGMPERLGIPRFRLVIVVPVTTDRGMPWAINSPTLYPSFPAGTNEAILSAHSDGTVKIWKIHTVKC